jgi:hypothetical protein
MRSANGVRGLEIVDASFVRVINVAPRPALWSPMGAHRRGVVGALRRDIEPRRALRASFAARRSQRSISRRRETIAARVVVNAAGLFADELSMALGGERHHLSRPRRVCPASVPLDLINGLVYRCRTRPGTASGCTHQDPAAIADRQCRGVPAYGNDYEGDRKPLESFVESARRLLPELRLEDLTWRQRHPPEAASA